MLAVRQGGGAGARDGPLSPPAVRALLTLPLFQMFADFPFLAWAVTKYNCLHFFFLSLSLSFSFLFITLALALAIACALPLALALSLSGSGSGSLSLSLSLFLSLSLSHGHINTKVPPANKK